MGGKSKSVVVSYWYKLVAHFGWCKGPIDAVLEIRGGDRIAWRGRQSVNGIIHIDQPDLYGGEKSEGGIVGDFEVMLGGQDQEPNSYLAQFFGALQSAYRGRATGLIRGAKIGAGNPYPKPWYFKLERIFKGWDNDDCWYPEKVGIKFASVKAADMDWRYLVVDKDDATNRAAVAYDDSAWAIGRPPFASHSWNLPESYGFSGVPATVVPVAKRVWMRTTVYMEDIPTNLRFQAFVDNDCRLFVNGTLVTTVGGNNGAYYDVAISTAAFKRGNNVIAVDGWDRHTSTFPSNFYWFDWRLVSDFDSFAFNPAHALYDSIVSRRESGGMEEPVGRINDASFRAAADKLYSETFGICTAWKEGESAEQFQQRILDLIGGAMSQSLLDGQYYLDLLRGDYVLADLPTLTDDDIIEWEDEPAVPSESINQIQVKWFDPTTREERITTPLQALGAIEDAGGVYSDIREYYEIPYEGLALRVGERDLRAASSPLVQFNITTTRKPYDLRPGMYLRLMCPLRGFADVVVVIVSIDYGNFGDDEEIQITALQDVFSLAETTYIEPQKSQDPGNTKRVPENVGTMIVMEAPYIEVATAMTADDLAALPPETGFLLVGAVRPDGGVNFQLATKAGGEDYQFYGNGDYCPYANIVEAAPLADAVPRTAFTYDGDSQMDQVEVGSWALWGTEIVSVDALDTTAKTITFGRGCADTVPVPHVAGDVVYFLGDWSATDSREYVDGETVYAKAMNRTGLAQIDISDAPEGSVVMDARLSRPYPPGKVRIDGLPYPATVADEFVVTWVHRNRVTQFDSLVDTEAASVTPADNTRYALRFLNASTSALLVEKTDIGPGTATVNLNFTGNVKMELYTIDANGISEQRHSFVFAYTGTVGNTIVATAYTPVDDSTIIDGGDLDG